jgi:hypothetical protein
MSAPARLRIAWLCCALLCVVPAWAAGGDKPAGNNGAVDKAPPTTNADAKYDLTGDGLVDAEDWAKMSEQEKTAYARESLLEIGLSPDAPDGNGHTRLQDYLDGLRSVYGP